MEHPVVLNWLRTECASHTDIVKDTECMLNNFV